MPRRSFTLLVLLLGFLPIHRAVGQSLLLQIRPRPGDTLHTRLDQTVEMTGRTRVGESDSTMTVVTNMLVLARTIVLRADTLSTTVLTLTDSVAVSGSGGRSPLLRAQTQELLAGKRITIRLAPDGSAEILTDDSALGAAAPALLGRMPATLPRHAVRVGQSWEQVMEVPLTGQPGTSGAMVRATLRLDSLTRSGRLAHISLRGELTRDERAADQPSGVRLSTTGTINGSMIVDRRLGWLTYSRSVMTVNSLLTPPPNSSAAPLRFQMKVTQLMRTMDKR